MDPPPSVQVSIAVGAPQLGLLARFFHERHSCANALSILNDLLQYLDSPRL